MASYLYKSSTGTNWDEDDEDFSAGIYETAAAQFLAPTNEEPSPHQHTLEAKIEVEVESTPAPVPRNLTHNYNTIDPFECPSFVWATAALWDADHERRPAYVELTDEDKYGYRRKRINYSSNWMHIKAELRCDMKLTVMVKPSPLQLSSTWENDSEGEYIREVGFLPPPLISPDLFNGSYSSSEQDEACTPPGSPSEVLFGQWKDTVDEVSHFAEIFDWLSTDMDQYDPEPSAIDVISNNLEAAECECSHEFADFNHISETLDIEDILGDTARDMLQSYINEPSECGSQISRDELEEALISTEATWEEEVDAVEDVGHEQAGKQAGKDTGKPVSNHIADEHIADLRTVNVMAHKLINIVKNSQIKSAPDTSIKGETQVIALETEPGFTDQVLENHNNARKSIGFVKDSQDTAAHKATNTAATQALGSDAKIRIDNGTVGPKQTQCDIHHSTHVSEFSKPVLIANNLSSDPKCIHEPTNTSLAWDTVATGWFVLSSLPWGRITVAAAGALIDVVACVARR